MLLVDSHCHLQDEAFDEDREEVISRSLETLDWLVVVGDDLASSRSGFELARERVYVVPGVHPYHGESVDAALLDELREMAASPYVVGIGEIGLDYFRHCDTPRDVQHKAFRLQLELAAELNLPVVIHNRDADKDTARIIDEYYKDIPGGVMHCFSGDADYVERCLLWDFHISFAGNVTFPKADSLRKAAKRVPLSRLLVETDSPYLAPQPVRGKRCEPGHVAHTVECIATLKGLQVEALAAATTQNAGRLFRVGQREA